MLQNISKLKDSFSELVPDIKKNPVYKALEWLVILALIYTTYQQFASELFAAKTNRDEEIKGYSVQIGQNHQEIYDIKSELKADDEKLRKWMTSISERVYRLESHALNKNKQK